MPRNQAYNGMSYPHFVVVLAAVGLKEVFVRLEWHEYLCDLSLVAYVTIWSFKGFPRTKSTCEYLFWSFMAPLHILGHKSCNVILYRGPRNKLCNLLKSDGKEQGLVFKFR